MGLIVCKTKEEVLKNFLIRKIVFIDEQNVSYEDEYDLKEIEGIMFLYKNDNNETTSCARAFINGNDAIIGRVATLKEYRKRNYSFKMMQEIEEYLKTFNVNNITVGAQIRVKEFYKKLGYKEYGEMFYDANIEHIHMKKIIKD